MNKGIAIFGGSFDPIHLGHVQTAFDIQNTFHFNHFLFMPCGQGVFKRKLHASPDDRFNMMRLALESYPDFEIDTREIKRAGPSFTILSLEELRQTYGAKEPINWILGEDAFQKFSQWHRYQDILKLANLIVVARPEQTAPWNEKIQILLKEHLTENINDIKDYPHGKIYFYPHSDYPYSSTSIRKALSEQKIPNGLDEKVALYIQTHACY